MGLGGFQSHIGIKFLDYRSTKHQTSSTQILYSLLRKVSDPRVFMKTSKADCCSLLEVVFGGVHYFGKGVHELLGGELQVNINLTIVRKLLKGGG